VDEFSAALPLTETSSPTHASVTVVLRRPVLPTWFALIQVLLVCGIPTLMFVMSVLILGTNLPVYDGSNFTLEFFALSSLLDTALIALLIRVFLLLSGETSRDVFLGVRPSWREALRGLALVPVLLLAVSGIGFGLRFIAPWTHNVAVNPYDTYMHSPIEASIFIIVVVLAGGVREELQRAFILHRFAQRLGGAWIGLGIYTIIFGALHFGQGIDAAVPVAVLGVVWGVLYLKRRSAVMGMVSHAGFDTAQVLLTFFAR
jgi:membrane protease YdiL (CAAX protease family)